MTAPSLRLEFHGTDNPRNPELELFIILQDYLESVDVKSAAAVAQNINDLIPTRRTGHSHLDYSDDVEKFLWCTWSIFIHVAKQVSHNHPSQDRLVELIRALTCLAPTMVEIWEEPLYIWADLPIFGPIMREALTSPTHYANPGNTDEVDRWVNLNSFAARLLNLDAVQWTSFAVWALRDALDEPADGLELDSNVRVAIQWITHSGRYLYQQILSGDYNRPDCDGVSLEAWQRWKRRFEEVGETLTTGSRGMARQTTVLMESIEQSMKK